MKRMGTAAMSNQESYREKVVNGTAEDLRIALEVAWGQISELSAQLDARIDEIMNTEHLVARLCMAAGEPIPEDAIARIQRWRAAADGKSRGGER